MILTKREFELMNLLWIFGPLSVAQAIEYCAQVPPPHFNTIATFYRILEKKGFVSHTGHKRLFYHPVVSKENYIHEYMNSICVQLFNGDKNRMLEIIQQYVNP